MSGTDQDGHIDRYAIGRLVGYQEHSTIVGKLVFRNPLDLCGLFVRYIRVLTVRFLLACKGEAGEKKDVSKHKVELQVLVKENEQGSYPTVALSR